MKLYLKSLEILMLIGLFLSPISSFSKEHAKPLRIIPNNWEIRAEQVAGVGSLKFNWKPLPKGGFKFAREFQGYIDFRTKIDLPKTSEEEPLGIYLGRIGDADKVYLNGHLIGQTGNFPPEYRNYLDSHREYVIHDDVIKSDGSNELVVKTYVEYVARKGLNTSEVVIGPHLELQRKAYVKNLTWYMLKIGIPILCLFLAFLSMPWISTKSQLKRQLLLFGIAICYCIFGLGRSRVIFHFLPVFPAYQIVVTSAMIGLVLIFLYSLDISSIKSKLIHTLAIGVPGYYVVMVYLTTNFWDAAAFVKEWFYVSIPLILGITLTSLFRAKEKSIFIRIGLVFLALVAINDIFLATRIIKSVNLMDFGFCVFIISMLVAQMAHLKKHWLELSDRESALVWSDRMLQMAKQVAHDIRSPLTSMTGAYEDIKKSKNVDESLKIIKLGIDRLTSISSGLLRKKEVPSKAQASPQPKLTLVDQVVLDVLAEARAGLPAQIVLETIGFEDSPRVWGIVDPNELQTSVSNIIRNSIEALETFKTSNPKVVVKLGDDNDLFLLQISDNGPGIPKEILPNIFEKGFTHRKVNGNGLGLHQAKAAIEANEGTISVASDKNGTFVTISLPSESKPNWAVEKVALEGKRKVFIVDDDPSFQEKLKTKILEEFPRLQISIASRPSELIESDLEDSVVIVDQNFSDSHETGLGWSTSIRPGLTTYLCTSEYSDPAFQQRVMKLGLKVIPKPLVADLRILDSES